MSEPSRRPADGRYGDNPNRLYQHHQFQVICKPSPDNIQELYLESLAQLGKAEEHDIRFVEDNWESPTLGAWGLGWEVWLDGMEITQFTYFQQVGGIDVKPVSSEITYGMERLAMYIQQVDNVYDLEWTPGVTYGDIFHQNEFEQSTYAFELSDAKLLFHLFDLYEARAMRVIDAGFVLPAYDYVLKCSHAFNLLDARGAISVSGTGCLHWPGSQHGPGLCQGLFGTAGKTGLPHVKGGKINEREDLLLEIGTEEIPAHYMPSVLSQIKELAKKNFDEANIAYEDIRSIGTPRRVALLMKGVAEKQADVSSKNKGPSIAIARAIADGIRRSIAFPEDSQSLVIRANNG